MTSHFRFVCHFAPTCVLCVVCTARKRANKFVPLYGRRTRTSHTNYTRFGFLRHLANTQWRMDDWTLNLEKEREWESHSSTRTRSDGTDAIAYVQVIYDSPRKLTSQSIRLLEHRTLIYYIRLLPAIVVSVGSPGKSRIKWIIQLPGPFLIQPRQMIRWWYRRDDLYFSNVPCFPIPIKIIKSNIMCVGCACASFDTIRLDLNLNYEQLFPIASHPTKFIPIACCRWEQPTTKRNISTWEAHIFQSIIRFNVLVHRRKCVLRTDRRYTIHHSVGFSMDDRVCDVRANVLMCDQSKYKCVHAGENHGRNNRWNGVLGAHMDDVFHNPHTHTINRF